MRAVILAFSLCDIRVCMTSWFYGGFVPLFEFTSRYFSTLWGKYYQRNITWNIIFRAVTSRWLVWNFYLLLSGREIWNFEEHLDRVFLCIWKHWINNRNKFDAWSRKWTLGNSRFIHGEKWFHKVRSLWFRVNIRKGFPLLSKKSVLLLLPFTAFYMCELGFFHFDMSETKEMNRLNTERCVKQHQRVNRIR